MEYAELSLEEIRVLPKISLHDHLDGAVRPATILEIAGDLGLSVPRKEESSLIEWISEKCGRGSLEEYLEVFALTSAVMQTFEGLKRVAREFVLDCAPDGVIYVECRWGAILWIRQVSIGFGWQSGSLVFRQV